MVIVVMLVVVAAAVVVMVVVVSRRGLVGVGDWGLLVLVLVGRGVERGQEELRRPGPVVAGCLLL